MMLECLNHSEGWLLSHFKECYISIVWISVIFLPSCSVVCGFLRKLHVVRQLIKQPQFCKCLICFQCWWLLPKDSIDCINEFNMHKGKKGEIFCTTHFQISIHLRDIISHQLDSTCSLQFKTESHFTRNTHL